MLPSSLSLYHLLSHQFGLSTSYEEQIARMPQDSPSHTVLRLLREVGEFRLSEAGYTAVSVTELAASLGWARRQLEDELLNLARRHIIAYACDGRLRWKDEAAQARTTLTKLRQDIVSFLNQADKTSHQGLRRGDTVYVNLEKLGENFASGVDLSRFAHFLFALSLEDAEPLRLFEHFARALRHPQPFTYECRLWQERGNRNIGDILKAIFRDLEQVMARLDGLHVTSEWQHFDILKIEPNYQARQQLHRWLLLLDMLGLIRYQGDPSMGLALTITFLQEATEDEVAIQLDTLRLKETYTKHKLKQIESYATLENHDARSQEFDRYFFGEEPLVEPLDPNLRTDLTDEQNNVARFAGGYHLVEGAAGSGKTTVLVEHVKYLVYQQQIPLERIMLATHFKGAVERIDKQLQVLKEDGSIALSATIQSFGNQIFTHHRLRLRRSDGHPYYAQMPRLLPPDQHGDSKQSELESVSEALNQLYNGTWPKQPWPEGLHMPQLNIPYLRNASTEQRCLSVFVRLRQQGIFPMCQPAAGEIQAILGNDSEQRGYTAAEYYAAYMAFLQVMGEKNHYMFDDQILFALAILRTNPGVRQEYRRHYEHVIIDEFQDFTRAASLLLLEICGLQPNALLFGDRDQDIRSKNTRAAELFQEFGSKDTCGRPHELRYNFRSRQEILDLATYVRNFEEPDNAIRAPLTAARGPSGEKPVFLRVTPVTSFPAADRRDAAEQIDADSPLQAAMLDVALERLSQLDEEESGKVALILANRAWLDPMQHLLRSRNISFSVLMNRYTYQTEHVANVLVYLRLIADSHRDDEVAWLLRNCIVPYVDRQQMKTLRSIARHDAIPLISVLRDEEALRRAQVAPDQHESLAAHLDLIDRFNVESLVRLVVDAINTIPHNPIASLADDDDKRKDVENVLRELAYRTVAQALEQVDSHILYLEEHQGNTSLCLTTVDYAKSEEFDTVFLLGAQTSSARITDLSRDKRRLYVTITRARERIFCLYEAGHLHHILQNVPPNLYDHESWPAEEASEGEERDLFDDIPF